MSESGWLSALLTLTSTSAVSFALSSILAGVLTLGAGFAPRLGRALLARSVELAGAVPTLLVLGTTVPASILPSFVVIGTAVGFALGVRLARALHLELTNLLGTMELVAARALGLGRMRTVLDHVWPHIKGHVYLNAALTPTMVVSAEAVLALLEMDDTRAPSLGGLLVLPGVSRYLALALVTTLTLLLTLGALSRRRPIRAEAAQPNNAA